MNLLGSAAIVLSVLAFAASYKLLRHRSLRLRVLFLCGFGLLAIP